MGFFGRNYLGDEELGKKDDDHRKGSMHPGARKSPWVGSRRRILLALVSVYFLYLFFKNMPTDLAPAPERFGPHLSRLQPEQHDHSRLRKPPFNPGQKATEMDHYYDGPINFHALYQTLYSLNGLYGFRRENKVALFIAADPKSLSNLLPLACEMASRKLNRVNFIVMGREGISIEGIKTVNGIDDTECPLFWHGMILFCHLAEIVYIANF